MPRGRVRFLSDREAYGFIERDDYGQDVFLHRADVEHGPLTEDTPVEFTITSAGRGPRARHIRALTPEDTAPHDQTHPGR